MMYLILSPQEILGTTPNGLIDDIELLVAFLIDKYSCLAGKLEISLSKTRTLVEIKEPVSVSSP
jgi:hypothetical protein